LFWFCVLGGVEGELWWVFGVGVVWCLWVFGVVLGVFVLGGCMCSWGVCLVFFCWVILSYHSKLYLHPQCNLKHLKCAYLSDLTHQISISYTA
jgi:hypothetical protein